MDKFKLLIIGNANHQYNIAFTNSIRLVIPDIRVSIISTHPIVRDDLKKIYDQLYVRREIHNITSKIKGVNAFLNGKNIYQTIIKNNLWANTILIQYANSDIALWGKLIKKRSKNYVVAFWGSDFYRTHKYYVRLNLKHADNVIIGSPQMLDDLRIEYFKYSRKFHLCYFGNSPIEHLKYLIETGISPQLSCDYFKWSKNKLNITIGHNGSKSHQHIAVLKEFSKLDQDITKNVRLILPITYGLTNDYLKEITEICEKSSFEYKVFTQFMPEIDIAHLRNLTDIMINMQTTDAFSGSMREVLYCGGVVINGSWLPYQFLKSKGIYFEEVDTITQLSFKISDIIVKYPEYRKRCVKNPSKIYSLSSWSHTIHNWKKVIEKQR
jgi:hypothetical protein